MQRKIWVAIAIVLVVSSCSWWVAKRRHAAAVAATHTHTHAPLASAASPDWLALMGGGTTRTTAGGSAGSATWDATATPGGGAASGPPLGGPIKTLRPETAPPYTLGPVPNGLTRVPEPPTLQPFGDADLPENVDGVWALEDLPANSPASAVRGLAVPPVQNPWSTDSWKFLLGTNINIAIAVVNNLFPSFPITARSMHQGPLMSGALVLKYDDSKRVVAIVRD